MPNQDRLQASDSLSEHYRSADVALVASNNYRLIMRYISTTNSALCVLLTIAAIIFYSKSDRIDDPYVFLWLPAVILATISWISFTMSINLGSRVILKNR